MNATDRVITALTPGTIFNKAEKIYRSLDSLSKFAGLSEDETIALLSGDLVDLVTCKPAKDQQTILVALIEVADAALPPADEEKAKPEPPGPFPPAPAGEDILQEAEHPAIGVMVGDPDIPPGEQVVVKLAGLPLENEQLAKAAFGLGYEDEADAPAAEEAGE
jgi:hypothetical protein